MNYENDDLPTYNEIVVKKVEHLNEKKQEVEYGLSDQIDENTQREIDEYAVLVNHIHMTYPLRYVKIDSSLSILLNLVVIILQIIATCNNAALSSYGTAVWGGVFNILIAVLALSTSKKVKFILGKCFCTLLNGFSTLIKML